MSCANINFVSVNIELIDDTWQAEPEFIMSDEIAAYVVVYSVEDRKSFEAAIDRLYELRHEEMGEQTASDVLPPVVILVANKVDLVRTRLVQEQGQWQSRVST